MMWLRDWVYNYTELAIAVPIGLFLLLVVSCNDPTEVTVIAPLDTVFIPVPSPPDTIWCKQVGHGRHRQWVCLGVEPIMEDEP